MRLILLAFACLAPFVLCGCHAASISETISSEPTREYFSAQAPADALSSLSLVADDLGLRTDLIDQQARRVVISNPHPYMGFRMSLIVFKADSDTGGSRLSAWSSGQNPIWFEWVDKIWEKYAATMTADGVQVRVISDQDARQ